MVTAESSKKRPPPTKLESNSKKRNAEKKFPEVNSHPTEKKRSKPVTHVFPIVEESDSDSEKGGSESWEDTDGEGLGEDDGLVDGGPLIDEDAMDVDEPARMKPQKDPNAARESHKVQKALLEQRKAAKRHSTVLTEAKRIWPLARQKNIPNTERQKYVKELMEVIRGKVKELVFKHDASRVVQTVVKYGRQKERDEIALELKGGFKDLAQHKYSKFLVTKLIRFCPTHRASILQEFQSNVLRLLLHREASSVLADAFELYANAYERTFLLRDFYGQEALLFGVTQGSAEDKERVKKGLPGFLEGVSEERKKRTLVTVKDNLLLIFNNSDKGAVTHAVVHRALREYLATINTLSNEAGREKLRREIFENCQELLAEMVHTKDGSYVVREFIAYGTAKDRKQILKILKPHIERMCLDDEAQLVLFTALDVIDDTKLLSKSLISEIATSANKIYEKPQGLRALVYLLTPRGRRHFMPAQITSLEETDTIRARTSKKDSEARASEIRKFASEPLLQWIVENGPKVTRDPRGSLVATEVMLYAEGDKTNATKILLDTLTVPYPSESQTPHPIDLAWTSRLYKTLLQGGHYNHKTNSIETTEHWDAMQFAMSLTNTASQNVLTAICTKGDRNGTFVVATLCETLAQGDKIKERQKLKNWFGEEERESIRKGEGRGKDLLLEKLGSL